jgi:hypothetical protein
MAEQCNIGRSLMAGSNSALGLTMYPHFLFTRATHEFTIRVPHKWNPSEYVTIQMKRIPIFLIEMDGSRLTRNHCAITRSKERWHAHICVSIHPSIHQYIHTYINTRGRPFVFEVIQNILLVSYFRNLLTDLLYCIRLKYHNQELRAQEINNQDYERPVAITGKRKRGKESTINWKYPSPYTDDGSCLNFRIVVYFKYTPTQWTMCKIMFVSWIDVAVRATFEDPLYK